MKPFLILQLRPEDDTSDNEYLAFLKFGDLTETEAVRTRIEKTGIPELTLDDYSGIIVGGSPFDIGKPEGEKSEIQRKIEADFTRLLDEVIECDFPFFGACSGNGLLGSHCGASISKKYSEPVAGLDIKLTEAGKEDPLLHGFPETFRALAGHKEACDDTPPGSTLLASSAACPVHMFRVGQNVYATQFHPEANAEGFTIRILAYKHHGYFEPHEAEEIIKQIEQEATPYAQEILRRFVARYRQN